MLVAGFPAGSFQTNCYVIAPEEGGPCVVVDPGQDAVEPLTALLARHRLTPAAVLLTHGHLDHTWSVFPVCDGNDIPAYIHPLDEEMLADPGKGVSPQMQAMLGDLVFREPREVRALGDGDGLDLAGVTMTVDHTPGHTRGSVVFRSTVDTEDGPTQVLLAGDTLFAGAIGRTDLPGGDHATMLESLQKKLLPLDDSTVVLPGHGPTTTIGRERASNPYLLGLQQPPRKGM
ncbi:MBL fold metallo-hydrolase [Rhodococcus sp. X156]|uniref:MBL fold metallo-hydrolase n=1 Tax=Rhodococcus sp. X156 TaxID=2499145 RepID=UPI000FDAEB89|nr:MBL fold metallo-hydrolase [Rhodococcus sp. X156]